MKEWIRSNPHHLSWLGKRIAGSQSQKYQISYFSIVLKEETGSTSKKAWKKVHPVLCFPPVNLCKQGSECMHTSYNRWISRLHVVNGFVHQEQPTCGSLPCCGAAAGGLGSRWGPFPGPSGGKTLLLDMSRSSFWGPSSRNSSLSSTSCSVKTSVSS